MSIDINKLQESILNLSNLLVEAEKQVQNSIESLPVGQKQKTRAYFEDIKKRSHNPNFDIKKEQEEIKNRFK